MGIPHLRKYMFKKLDSDALWKTIDLDGNLVLDGNAVLFQIYEDAKISWCEGGQYSELRTATLNFVDGLIASGIKPYFVFDGIVKRKYLAKRNSRIRKFRRIRDYLHCYLLNPARRPAADADGGILGILSMEVFLDALNEREVHYFFADGEADHIIASLANNTYNCPVVSNDSDFFFFNLTHGYIPVDRLKFISGSTVRADVYYQENFCRSIRLDRELWLAMPVCLGADFIKKVEIGQSILYSQSSTKTEADHAVESAINFLRPFKTVTELLDATDVVQYDSTRKHEFEKAHSEAKKFYSVADLKDPENETILSYLDGPKLPTWLLKKYRKGNFAPSLMEALIYRESLLYVVPDDPNRETALRCSRPIRRAIYGMLGKLDKCRVKEHERTERRQNISTVCVKNEKIIVEGNVVQSYIEEEKSKSRLIESRLIDSLNHKEQKMSLCRILGCSVKIVDRVEKEWQLVVAASYFWAKKANPSVEQIQSLVLTFLKCFAKADRSYCSESTLASHSEQQKWRKCFHCYAQWQCVYKDSMALNNILNNPLLHIPPAHLFDGKMVMNYALNNNRIVKPKERKIYNQLVSILKSAKLPDAVKCSESDTHFESDTCFESETCSKAMEHSKAKHSDSETCSESEADVPSSKTRSKPAKNSDSETCSESEPDFKVVKYLKRSRRSKVKDTSRKPWQQPIKLTNRYGSLSEDTD